MARSLSEIKLGDLRRRMGIARAMDTAKLSQDQVAVRVGRVLDAYSTRLTEAVLNGVFRARKNPTPAPFDRVAELWYPPADRVGKMGRLNRAGQSVFYATDKMHAAIIEVRPQAGDIITVLDARVRDGIARLKCGHVGLERGLSPALKDLQAARQGGLPRYDPSHVTSLGGPSEYSKWLSIDDYLGDIFTEIVPDGHEHRYKATNAVVDILWRIPEIQAVIYPSVATSLKAMNLCLKPTEADRHLVPARAGMVQILQAFPGNLYRIHPLRGSGSIDAAGRITWGPERPVPEFDPSAPVPSTLGAIMAAADAV